jgi:hypothetical protein
MDRKCVLCELWTEKFFISFRSASLFEVLNECCLGVKGKDKSLFIHATKAYRRTGGIAPRILNLDTVLRWVFSLTPNRFTPGERTPITLRIFVIFFWYRHIFGYNLQFYHSHRHKTHIMRANMNLVKLATLTRNQTAILSQTSDTDSAWLIKRQDWRKQPALSKRETNGEMDFGMGHKPSLFCR